MHSNDSGRPLRQFLTYYRPHRRLFALDMLFALLSCAADLAFPYVSRQAMLRLLPLGLYRTFFAVMAALLAAYLLKAVFKYAVTVIGHRCGVLIEADMRQALFEHLQTMSFRFFDQNRTGVLMSRMTSDLFSITELAHHGPEYLLTAVVTLGGALALMAPICWQLTLVLLLLVPLSVWITMRQRRRMNDANVAVKRRQAEINTVIESGISGVRTAKAFTNEAAEREKFLACNDRYKHSKTDWYRAMGVFQGGMEFTMSAMQVVVIALGGAFIMRGQMDYVDLITFSLYVTTFISPIRTLVNFMEVFTDGTAGFQRFLELMRIQPDIADAPDARELPPVRGQVDYNDVSFDYAGGVNVLSHIDLHIAPGETLAVVGPSGGRQDDAVPAAAAVLRRDAGLRLHRRHRCAHRDAGIPAPLRRRAAAGGVSVCGHHPRKHPLRPPRRHGRRDRAGRALCRDRPRDPRHARRVRHLCRRARRHALRRTEAAAEHRAPVSEKSADPHPRRGHECARLRDRAAHPARARHARPRPHVHPHRPPAEHRAGRRPHRRDRRRAHLRARARPPSSSPAMVNMPRSAARST